MDAWLRSAGGRLPAPIAPGIRALIERLQPADELCHGDLHPGNVIMTAEGPRLVDWTGTVRAPAAYDLGISHILLTELAPEIADDPERPRAVNAAAQAEYARLAGLSPAALTAAIEPYLPIARVLMVLGGAVPDLRERLLQRIEAALNQPASISRRWLAGENRQLSGESPLVGGPRFAAREIGRQVRIARRAGPMISAAAAPTPSSGRRR